MRYTLQQLFELEDEKLFGLAREKTNLLETRFWGRVIINSRCTTQPRCFHCKWECFKTQKQMLEHMVALDDVLRNAEGQVQKGACRLVMPSGWMGYNLPNIYFEYVRAVKSRFDIEVAGLFGAIDRESLISLKQAGMDGYQCGLESINEDVFRRFRPGGDSLTDRINTLKWAHEMGIKLWSGFIYGFGQQREDMLKGIEALKDLSVSRVSIQPFLPYAHTAFERMDPPNPFNWARVVAAAALYLENADMLCVENQGVYYSYSQMAGIRWYPVPVQMSILGDNSQRR